MFFERLTNAAERARRYGGEFLKVPVKRNIAASLPSRGTSQKGWRASQTTGALGRDKLYVPVVEAFERKILSGELSVGDRLPSEADIARTFTISTRSVREAIQILETKGLVQRKHGERALVVRDDVGEFLGSLALTVRQLFSQRSDYFVQLMDVRRMIEIEAVGRLTSGEAMLNDEVEEALTEMHQAVVHNDFSHFVDCDAAFHLGLVHSVGNEILNLFYNNLFSLILEVIQVSSRVPKKPLDEAYAEHETIYRLIQEGNREKAQAAMRWQIEESTRYLKLALDQRNGVFSDKKS